MSIAVLVPPAPGKQVAVQPRRGAEVNPRVVHRRGFRAIDPGPGAQRAYPYVSLWGRNITGPLRRGRSSLGVIRIFRKDYLIGVKVITDSIITFEHWCLKPVKYQEYSEDNIFGILRTVS